MQSTGSMALCGLGKLYVVIKTPKTIGSLENLYNSLYNSSTKTGSMQKVLISDYPVAWDKKKLATARIFFGQGYKEIKNGFNTHICSTIELKH